MKWLTLLITLFCTNPLYSQDLLANGGFEDINTCPEYNVECAPEAWISSLNSVINFFKDPNRAHLGKNCMSVEAGHDRKPFNRTFIRTRLLCGLRKGNVYRITFFIKSPHHVFDSVGLLFGPTDPLLSRVPITRQAPSLFLRDKVGESNIKDSNWHRIEMDYTANGEENYLSIGYFAKNDFSGRKVSAMENRFFFFVDDISIVPVDPNEGMCKGWERIRDEIYDENERHEWLEKKLKYRRSIPPPPLEKLTTTYVKIDTLLLPDILFASGKAVLDPSSYPLLDSIARKIRVTQVDSIVIGGHTDSMGTLEMNMRLSIDRANAVSNYLNNSAGYSNIIIRGFAFLKPVADNSTPDGRKKNRRVEVYLYTRE